MSEHVILAIAALLGVSMVVVAIAHRLHMPAILGYILVGMLVGPDGLGWIQSDKTIHLLAEVGIVFLLFSIGLEFSVPQMLALRRHVFGMGTLQVVLTTLVIFLLAIVFFDLDTIQAFVIGAALALSSTAIVIKQLADQGELQSRHGRAAVGILIFQDLMAIPLLIVVPALGNPTEGELAATLAWSLLKGLGVTAVLLLAGRYLLRPLFHEVAHSRSEELFTLTVLTVALLAASLAESAGISMTLGAFIAGMMLGETEYRHQIESDIRPFRDVLLGLFFITVGMGLSFKVLGSNFAWIVALTLAIMTLKTLIILLVGWLMRKPLGISLRTALSLNQVGEFGLVLLTLAGSYALLDGLTLQWIMTAAVLSMMVAPILIKFNGVIAKRLDLSYGQELSNREEEIREETEWMKNHVILCGFGRVGQMTARFLKQTHEPYVALDMDITRVHLAKQAGEPVFYGNSSRPSILEAAHIDRARLVSITYGDPQMALKTLETVRRLRPDIPVLVRLRDDRHYEDFMQAGATEVISDTFEASLLLSAEILLKLGHSETEVLNAIDLARKHHKEVLEGFYQGEGNLTRLKDQGIRKLTHTVPLTADSYATGRTLADLGLKEMNVKVQAVKRGHIRGENPEDATRLRDEDVVVLVGEPEDLERAEHFLQSGK